MVADWQRAKVLAMICGVIGFSELVYFGPTLVQQGAQATGTGDSESHMMLSVIAHWVAIPALIALSWGVVVLLWLLLPWPGSTIRDRRRVTRHLLKLLSGRGDGRIN